MTFVSKITALFAVLLCVGACGFDRGEGRMCSAAPQFTTGTVAQSGFDPTDTGLLPSMAMRVDEVAPSMADAFRQSVDVNRDADADARPAASRAVPAPIEIDVLSLSAGGQYGSFGAGFLRGWSQNPKTPRPNFDLVTGVSAGGMLAPVAFSGTSHDAALDVFRGLSRSGVFRPRPVFTLGNAPSLFNPAPLETTLKTLLTDDMIRDIARQHATGARLLVMAVDLDTTRATVFDLGEMAASGLPLQQRRDCMAEVMLASAAIPGVFPPRNIDGTLYVDGGLRDQIFLREVESARAILARDTGREVRVRATIVINGSLKVPEGNVKDSLIGYAERSLYTLSDEVLRDSIAETLSFAESNTNWEVRGVIADLPVEEICPLGESVGTFDACVTNALFASGVKLGKSSPVDFMTSAELRALATAY